MKKFTSLLLSMLILLTSFGNYNIYGSNVTISDDANVTINDSANQTNLIETENSSENANEQEIVENDKENDNSNNDISSEDEEILVQSADEEIAVTSLTTGHFTVDGPSNGFSYDNSNGVLTISSAGTYTISRTDTSSTRERIVVTASAEVILNGVNLNSNGDGAALEVQGNSATNTSDNVTATIKLKGENILTTLSTNYAGLQLSNGANVILENGAAESEAVGSLTVTGGDKGAGIGSGNYGTAGNITIDSGTVTATGGIYAAGIGSGHGKDGNNNRKSTAGNITIIGGKVTVKAGERAAGIGSGWWGIIGNITISDGEITAETSNADSYGNGAGIGAGRTGLAGNIDITGGTIKSTGSNYGVGIGAGAYATMENITISGGTVTATGGDHGAGIGSGFSDTADNSNVKAITISGGTVTATGGINGAGIGSGYANGAGGSKVETITISGGTVTAKAGNSAVGIGKGSTGLCTGVQITGGSVKAMDSSGTVDSISPEPTSDGTTSVYLGILENQDRVQCITVDNVDYKVAGNHPDDSSLYLYMTGTNHAIAGNGWYTASYGDGKFTISASDIGGDLRVYNEEGNFAAYICSYASNVMTISATDAEKIYTIKLKDGITQTSDRIVINTNATIVLDNVSINTSAGTPLEVQGNSATNASDNVTATIKLKGTNKLTTTNINCAGLQLSNGANVILENGAAESETVGSLTATGGGTTSKGGAGIGSGSAGIAGNINIKSGNITATGGYDSAGIGTGGSAGTVGNITIIGGTLKVYGGKYSAGIGSGSMATAGNITINGDAILEEVAGGSTSGAYAGAGIGAGHGAKAGYIKIENATIKKVTAQEGAAGIGAGCIGTTQDITIINSSITVTGGNNGAGIGSGYGATTGDITISGGTVTATGGYDSAGIGTGGSGAKAGKIIISDGTMTATGGNFAPGIGAGSRGSVGGIDISGGDIIANGGVTSAGIGSSGYNASCGNITISGGKITATGANGNSDTKGGSGIGAGGYTNTTVGSITISGGTVTAKAGNSAVGIGKGSVGSCTGVQITGGSVKAMDSSGTVNSISPAPTSDGTTSVYLGTLKNQAGVQSIIVDNVDYKVAGNHPNDSSLYLYMTGTNHIIDGDGWYYASYGDKNFTISDSDTVDLRVYNQEGQLAIDVFGYASNVVTINATDAEKIYTVKLRNGITQTSDRIVIKTNATIVLDNVSINTSTGAALEVQGNSATNASDNVTATIKLKGENILKTTGDHAGLQLSNGANLNLENGAAESETVGSLTVTGGDNGAGIGSGNFGTAGNITIDSGTVTATGRTYTAGIGSGNSGSAGDITISGGTVTADTVGFGAGIGTGENGTAGDITISGGTVTATGRIGGTSIGAGHSSNTGNSKVETITISGGTVTATSGINGAGIGSGYANGAEGSKVETITISGGTVTATGGDGAAGIGSGYSSSTGDSKVETITISGGTVTATGGVHGAGIGTGTNGTAGDITISGGTVTATAISGDSAGIGKGSVGSCTGVQITGGSVKAMDSSDTVNSISPAPTSDGKTSVYLGILENQAGVQSIIVDNVDYKVAGNHPDGDNNFYLYMTGTNHIIAGNSWYTASYDSSSNNFTFNIKDLEVRNEEGNLASDVCSYESDVVTISATDAEKIYTIKLKDGITQTSDRVVINTNATIVLENVNINTSAGTPLEVQGNSATNASDNVTATIKLKGENILTPTGIKYAGLQLSNGANLNLENGAAESETVGSLTATGGYFGAGIGSGNSGSAGDITISGGTVTATGGDGAAGIGSGYSSDDGSSKVETITISGGTVTATGGNKGAGIGSGHSGGTGSSKVETITISGGTVTATGGSFGAGIGSGYSSYTGSSKVETITISGGTVTAKAGNSAVGIGKGSTGSCTGVQITGGSVKAMDSSGTVDSISPEPTSDGTNRAYLATLPDQSNVKEVTVSKYTVKETTVEEETGTNWGISSNHPDDTSLYLYFPEQHHKIIVNSTASSELTYYAKWMPTNKFMIMTNSTYLVTIPNTVKLTDGTTATEELTIRDVELIPPDIKKEVKVSISDTDRMILTRENDPDSENPATAKLGIYKGNTTDIALKGGDTVVTAKDCSGSNVETTQGITIGVVDSQYVKAGEYTGSVTFAISLAETKASN